MSAKNSFSPFDYYCMQRAVELAQLGTYSTSPNPKVGCVIAQVEPDLEQSTDAANYNKAIIGTGWHRKSGAAHAEIIALEAARQRGHTTKNATVYINLEPCSHYGKTPPCADSLIAAEVKRVVIAMLDPNEKVDQQGVAKLKAANIAVEVGLLAEQAVALNAGFISLMQRKRPWLRLKLAASLDGRTAMANGDSKWITATAAREDNQRLRAEADAIITGIGTVLADNPEMNCRYSVPDGYAPKTKQPLRVVLDSNLTIAATANIILREGEVLICHRQRVAQNKRQQLLKVPNVKLLALAQDKHGRLDLKSLLYELGARDILQVHVEAGAKLSASFLAEGLVDQLVLYQAACVMGSLAMPLFDLQLSSMQQVKRMQLQDVARFGNDVRLSFSQL